MVAPHVLLVVLALSGAGQASGQQVSQPQDAPRQTMPPPPLVPATPEGTAPESEPGPSSSETLPPEASPRGELIPRHGAGRRQDLGFFPRLGIGLFGGAGGGLAGAGAGALLGHLLVAPIVGCDKEVCAGARMSGAILGALMGVPGGTYFADKLAGGQGTYVSALNGTLLGGVIGLAGLIFVLDEDPEQEMGIAMGLLALPVVGSTVAYQLSHEHSLGDHPTRGGSSPIARVLLETLFGGVGGAVLGVTGLVGGLLAGGCSIPDGCFSTGDEIAFTSTTVAVYAIGTSLGTYGAGVLMEGRGGFWPTMAGSALGAVAGTAVAFTLGTDEAVLLLMAATPLAGAIVGYEVSAAYAEPELGPAHAQRSTSGVQVVPVIAATPAGGILGGLAGRF